MRTLGVDLSSQDRDTAVCVLHWEAGRCTLERLATRVDNDEIVALIAEDRPTGIDAPFGWPARFVAALTGWTNEDRWPEIWDLDTQRALRLRETDRWIQREIGKWPLSVSADSIAMCAMRAATIVSAAARPVDRVNGPIFEVYPGAALIRWGLAPIALGYKKAPEPRVRFVDAIAPADGWLFLDDDQRARLAETDHAIDALLSALVARAAATNRTVLPGPEFDRDVIAREGWIHLPTADSLGRLA